MSNQVYVQVGEGSDAQFVPLSEVENAAEIVATLPEELVQGHPDHKRVTELYRTTAEESNSRKQRAQTAEQRLADLLAKKEDSVDKDTPKINENSADTPRKTQFDPNELYEQFRTRLMKEQAQEAAKRNAEQTAVSELMEKHGLVGNDDAETALLATSEETREALAASLGRFRKQFADIPTGDGEEWNEETLMKRVLARLDLN